MSIEETIFNTAVEDGMPTVLATLLVAQSKHETGDYKHKFFTEGKNAFGYSYYAGSAWQLPTPGTNADNGLPIARYASIMDSVHEMTSWIKRRQKEGKFPADLSTISTAAQYALLLKNSGYYGAPLNTYTAALEGWLKTLGELAKQPSTWIVIAVIAGLIYKYRKRLFA